jgi:predicted MFS family arabinose efflux permease
MKSTDESENTDINDNSINIKLIISSILLLILALGFNTMLSLSSLEDIYIDSTFSKYTAIGNDLKRNIEKSIKFGKNINKLIGMDDTLKETLKYLEQDNSQYFKEMNLSKIDSGISLSIALPENIIQYSTDSSLVEKKLPLEVQSHFESIFQNRVKNGELSNNYYKAGSQFYIGLPIYKTQAKPWVGSIVLILNENQVNTFIYKILINKLKVIGIILVSVLIILIFFFFVALPFLQKKQDFSRKKISATIILILLCSQILFSLLNTNSFKTYYLEITREKTTVLGNLLKEDIEYLLKKRIKLKSFYMMEKMLGEILSVSSELSNITIFDSKMKPLYMADKKAIIDFKKSGIDTAVAVNNYNKFKDTNYNLLIDLKKKPLNSDGFQTLITAGYISITISKDALFSELMSIILDSITVLIISVLFLMELLVMVFQYFAKEAKKIKKTVKVNYTVIRPAIFLYFFGQTISVSFLPLYMEQLYEPFLGLSKEMIMGLPICTTMLFGAISPLIAGPWVDKRGWHESLFTGFILTSFGFVYTWLAPNAMHLIISRAFVGFGYGLTFMAANGFVVYFTDDNSKTQGLTYLIAGCFAGYICGSSTGGMLADRMGYNSVFIIGAIIIIFSILYALVFMKNAIGAKGPAHKADEETEQSKVGQLLQFVTDIRVLALCFFIILPSSMVTVGFINYFIPIYIDSIGSTPSNIGRLLMVHGLFFIYVAPFFSKFIDRSSQKSKYILLSALICSCSLILFPFVGGLLAAVISILLLGFAGSFEAVIPFALSFKSTKKLGDAKAIAILSSVEKLGQVMGPLIFGWLILGQPGNNNLYIMGAAYLLAALLFSMISRSYKLA